MRCGKKQLFCRVSEPRRLPQLDDPSINLSWRQVDDAHGPQACGPKVWVGWAPGIDLQNPVPVIQPLKVRVPRDDNVGMLAFEIGVAEVADRPVFRFHVMNQGQAPSIQIQKMQVFHPGIDPAPIVIAARR